ncbi:DUF5597 domain-containing protein [Arthrobacter sp. efr-133-TYG-118]|uniref:DUF5597 domain-containing protein n=1 Tax=Arthrobacter sp. efr-133-TYG-118 TaxID=3040279 RepID=UPI00254DB8B6|nr:DUF5597 domain-containing protein [Arthrobacter sp. efr-133-TYG-118]
MTPQLTRPAVELAETGLLIDGDPFIVVGGELHNSSSSTAEAIDTGFRHVRSLGANTVLAPVSWAQFEPVEGRFDFSLIDAMLEAATRTNLRLIPLWFASWKNGMSSYAPDWVKRDTERFVRARTSAAGIIEHLSPFGVESRLADSTAFAALMAHIDRVDVARRVILVQVQNEVGLLGDSRDRSSAADVAWAQPVPAEVVTAIAEATETPAYSAWRSNGARREGSWSEVLGTGTDAEEAFMAWGYATYVEAVSRAGRQVNPVPLFANVWLDSDIELDLPESFKESALAVAGGMQPGIYPSGGPVMRVARLWAACAPTLDFVSPDVYFGEFDDIFASYRATFGHLFIPEMRTSAIGVSHMFRAIGEHRAVGVSPFGVDAVTRDSDEELILKDGYRLLTAVSEILREHPAAHMRGFMLDVDHPTTELEFEGFSALVGTADPYGFQVPVYPAYGIVVEASPGELFVVGRGFVVTFTGSGDTKIGILAVTELELGNGWSVVRELNGDQTGSGSRVRLPALGEVLPSIFPIPPFTEATAILKVRTYSY